MNPHVFRHMPLKHACLPFHHPSEIAINKITVRSIRIKQKITNLKIGDGMMAFSGDRRWVMTE